MRIAYLTQSYPPVVSGAAVVVHGLAEGMARHRHQVLVLTASENARPYHVYKPCLTIQRYRSLRNPLRADHHFSLWPHIEIMQSLQKFRPDVIHSHDPLQFAISGLEYARRTGIFSMLTIHQLPWFINAYLPDWPALKTMTEKALWLYTSRVLSRFNTLVTPTRTIANEVANHTGLNAQVIGYGLDPLVFHPDQLSAQRETALRSKLGLPQAVRVLLYAGRLDLDKRVDLVIRAAACALTHSNAHLVLAGDGTEKSRLMQLASGLGIGARCHFPGFIARDQGLPDVFRLASVFVTASEIETQGLALLEAAACGLPIVAVNATCIPEVVRDGINGYLAAPGSVKELAEYIKKLLADPALAQALGQAGSQLSREFCLEKTLGTYETLYQQALAKAKTQPLPHKTNQTAFNLP